MIGLIKIESSAAAGSAVQPISEDWLDVSSGGPLSFAPDTSLGYHDYSHDISQGLRGDSSLWERDAVGLYPTADGTLGSSGTVVINAGACSLRYDPYFEFIFLLSGAAPNNPKIYAGASSEAISDTERLTWHRVAQVWNSGTGTEQIYTRCRNTGSTLRGAYTYTDGHYYRVRVVPEDGGYISIHDLGASPADWDVPGTLEFGGHFSDGTALIGGNVLAPQVTFADVAGWYDCRFIASKTTMRRA